MAKIYTRRGDQGETSLIGARVPKTDPRIQALGEVDELNALIGVVLSFPLENALSRSLLQTQKDLFVLGTMLASARPSPKTSLTLHHVRRLERTIDRYQAKLPPLRRFILPGGSLPAALLHFARALCRRAERSLLALKPHHPLPEYAVPYLNRLSDLLFVLARAVNQMHHMPETLWIPEEKRK